MKNKTNIISTLDDKPRLGVTWVAMVLGLSSLLCLLITVNVSAMNYLMSIFQPFFGTYLRVSPGTIFVFTFLALTILSMISSIYSFKKGERSWAMWLGLVPAILSSIFWLIFIIGEFAFPH